MRMLSGSSSFCAGVGGEDVAHARGDAAIDDRGDALLPGDGVQLERVLGEERDVDDGLPGLEDGPERPEAHGAGDGADDHVVLLDDPPHVFSSERSSWMAVMPLTFLDTGQGLGVDIDDGDLEILVLGEVEGHRAADQARA